MKKRDPPAPLRFAVIGLGHVAQAAVLPAFRHAKPHVELTALVSGTRTKLFDSGAIEAVYVATPDSEHMKWVVDLAHAPRSPQRPTPRHEIRRPPMPREPPRVQAESGHR